MSLIDYLRQFRIGQYAIFDFASAFLGMALISPILSWLFAKFGVIVPKRNWVILTLPISVLIHVLIGNITPLTRDFFDLQAHPFTKLIIVGCLIFGLKGINIVKRKKMV